MINDVVVDFAEVVVCAYVIGDGCRDGVREGRNPNARCVQIVWSIFLRCRGLVADASVIFLVVSDNVVLAVVVVAFCHQLDLLLR